ncbi:MAG: hypothetical protein EOM05_05725 [Clostridia bacterium]|nr:hypothetical protein [Clostridia bacterium]
MQKITSCICLACIFLTLCACSFVGETDFAMFEERFNKANEDVKLTSSNIICDKQNENIKYDCFFDAENGGKYMMTVYEKNDANILSSCTLCVLSSIKLDVVSVKELFCSMLFAYAQVDEQKALEIFEELELSDKKTYETPSSIKKTFGDINVEVLVNGAGAAITVT